MKLLFLTLFLAIIQTTPPIQPTPSSNIKKSAATTQKPNSDIPSAVPASVDSTTVQPCANSCKTDQIENKEQSLKIRELPAVSVSRDWVDRIALFCTLALVIVGTVGVIAAFRTLKGIETQTGHIARQALSMRRQTTHLKNSVKAAQAGVEAALLNARAIIDSERPWIEIELGPPESDPLDENDAGLFNCSVRIKNHGRTVALIENVHIGINSLNTQFPNEPLNGTTKNFYSLLGSGQNETVWGFDADSLPDAHSILDGTKRGFLQIIVKYRDVLKGTIVHETSVVYVFQNSLEDPPERISILNVYS
jgi:hypothetical protein